MSKYGNIITQQITDTLPQQTGSTWNPTWEQLTLVGWREITMVDKPTEGYRIVSQKLVEIDKTTARLAVAKEINLADEAAAIKAAAAASKEFEATTDNWPKSLRLILTIIKPAIKPALTVAEYKAWLKSEYQKL
ncbi:MAG: hypothetical protein WC426_14410 [Sulfuriferula sp.]